MISHHLHQAQQRKHDLISSGLWALITGRGWMVRAVQAALVRKGLVNA
jgi:hypothetical protein